MQEQTEVSGLTIDVLHGYVYQGLVFVFSCLSDASRRRAGSAKYRLPEVQYFASQSETRKA
jgi:hypothetical protein